MPNKLNDQEVLHIRRHVAEGGLRSEMRDLYRVSSETIARICRGDSHQQVRVRMLKEAEMKEKIAESEIKLLEIMAKEPVVKQKTAKDYMDEAEALLAKGDKKQVDGLPKA